MVCFKYISANTQHKGDDDDDDASNNRSNWKHLKIVQKVPEQRTGKSRNHETTENSHIGHCTHTSESTDVKVQ